VFREVVICGLEAVRECLEVLIGCLGCLEAVICGL